MYLIQLQNTQHEIAYMNAKERTGYYRYQVEPDLND